MCVQTFLAELAIERFDECIVRGLATAIEVDLYLIGVSPQIHLPTRELRAVIAGNALRSSALVAEVPHCRDDMLCAQGVTYLNSQTFACIEIDHRQCSKLPTVSQLIVHEVHAPNLVGSAGCPLHLSMRGRYMPPADPTRFGA